MTTPDSVSSPESIMMLYSDTIKHENMALVTRLADIRPINPKGRVPRALPVGECVITRRVSSEAWITECHGLSPWVSNLLGPMGFLYLEQVLQGYTIMEGQAPLYSF